jgi:hypothetical protein
MPDPLAIDTEKYPYFFRDTFGEEMSGCLKFNKKHFPKQNGKKFFFSKMKKQRVSAECSGSHL